MTAPVPVESGLQLGTHVGRLLGHPCPASAHLGQPGSAHVGRPDPAGTKTRRNSTTRPENGKEAPQPHVHFPEAGQTSGRPGQPGTRRSRTASTKHKGGSEERESICATTPRFEGSTTNDAERAAEGRADRKGNPTTSTLSPDRREAKTAETQKTKTRRTGRAWPGRTSRATNTSPGKTSGYAGVAEGPVEMQEAAFRGKEHVPRKGCATSDPAEEPGTATATSPNIDEILTDKNVNEALKTLLSRGEKAPGVDGLPVKYLRRLLASPEWPRTLQKIREGTYTPSPIRPCEIPKSDGGKRTLGIPTAQDRLIQTMLLNVLDPIFDPDFSDYSYGFRKGRSAHDALQKLRQYIQEGHRWIVKMDLSKFFDRVDHDILMARVTRKVQDKKILRLIRAYLQAGVLREGRIEKRIEGTPQGGPISPLLANILLDGLDAELERRGLPFVRYADDFVILVKSERAAGRVMESVKSFLEKSLKLRVNTEKSGVERPWERAFLGYKLTDEDNPRFKVSEKRCRRFEERVGELEGRERKDPSEGIVEFIIGWTSYFRLAEETGLFEGVGEGTRERLELILGKGWEKGFTAENLKDFWKVYRKSGSGRGRKKITAQVKSGKTQTSGKNSVLESGGGPRTGKSIEREDRKRERSVCAESPERKKTSVCMTWKEVKPTGGNLQKRDQTRRGRLSKQEPEEERPSAGACLDNRGKGMKRRPTKNALNREEGTQQRQTEGWPNPTGNPPDQADADAGRPTGPGVFRWMGGGAVTPPDPLVSENGEMEQKRERRKCARSGVECFP